MSDKLPLVSVILPVYNAEKYLYEALSSIVEQTYANLEIIVINDGSTDKSLSIIKEFTMVDERIKIINRENKGLIYSLNEAISISTGKYIARMDADDISLPLRIEKQVQLLETGYDICGCHYFEIDENNEYINASCVLTQSRDIPLALIRSVPFAHGSVTFRHDFLLNNNLMYGNTEYKKAEDYALWCDFYSNGARFSNVNDFLFKYRNIDGTLTSAKQHKLESKKLSSLFCLNNKIELIEIIKNRTTLLNTKYTSYLAYFYLVLFFKGDFNMLKCIKKLKVKDVIYGFFLFK
ncbi:glycosyltransferase family 2 protein [Photobacterium leiognathi]|uniref:glycosyltransferase family 2 protein n=1 Tax=Photobacterium leiognathi TaxID=553611 RepID=UPI00298232B7|nr:glycosyltransferase family 2 protein [Photobacterium leiognathi]